MLEDFDKNISIFTESIARRLSRRKMVGTTVKGVFATVAAATIGQVVNLGQAFAVTCTCDQNWTTGHRCGFWGFPCPQNTSLTNGCPSSCPVCIRPDCGGWCEWSSGHW